MAQNEIEAIRALLTSKPRPVGWAERRRRIEEVGASGPPPKTSNSPRWTSADFRGMVDCAREAMPREF